ncbi:MAG: hypothetical protein JW881_13585 [Spirochaetales bacterium]|nr:hypothetical protein [Spirochaetales bacterium]
MNNRTHWLYNLLKSPVFLIVFGIVTAAVSVFFGIVSFMEMESFGDEIRPMSLAEFADSGEKAAWVVLTNFEPTDQALVKQSRGRYSYDILFKDREADLYVIITLELDQPIESLDDPALFPPQSGVVKLINDIKYGNILRDGMEVPDREKLYYLCTFCGPDNSRLGVIISIVFVCAGLALVVLAVLIMKKVITIK